MCDHHKRGESVLTVMSTFRRLILDGPAVIDTDDADEVDGPPSKILSSFMAILAGESLSMSSPLSDYPVLSFPRCSVFGSCKARPGIDGNSMADVPVSYSDIVRRSGGE